MSEEILQNSSTGTGKRPLLKRQARRLLLGAAAVCLALAALAALTACSGGANVSEVQSQPYTVSLTGVVPASSGTTYGAAMDKYCPGGTWKQFTGTNGQEIVEYDGGSSPEGKADVQWVKSSAGWTVWAMEIDGSAITQFHINTFFSAAQ